MCGADFDQLDASTKSDTSIDSALYFGKFIALCGGCPVRIPGYE
jgi:hypothetical protein